MPTPKPKATYAALTNKDERAAAKRQIKGDAHGQEPSPLGATVTQGSNRAQSGNLWGCEDMHVQPM